MVAFGKAGSESWRVASEAASGYNRRLEAGGVSSTVSYAGSDAEAESDPEVGGLPLQSR
jgi:hypothetical protein